MREGASVVLYKNTELRKGQFYVKTDWRAVFMVLLHLWHTRGGPIAATWTALHLIGEEGYRRMAWRVMEETHLSNIK